MFEMPPRERILERYEQAKKRIEDFHIRTFPEQPGPIFLISTAYPGVWMEHAFDAVCYARLNPDSSLAKDVARSQMLLFLRNQRPDGHLPFNVVDTSLNTGRLHPVGYSQIQECVSFARLCLEVYEITGDMDFLKEAYAGCALINTKTGKTLVKPYTILNKQDLKIAVVGLTTEDTAKLGNPEYLHNVKFEDPTTVAKATLKELNEKVKPDVKIALTHMGYYYDAKHGSNAPGDVSLARNLDKGAFDMIIGGHSHDPICVDDKGVWIKDYQPTQPCKPDFQNGTWIMQAFEWGKYVGRADFEFKNGELKLVNYQLIPVNLKKKVKKEDGKTEYVNYAEEIPQDPEMEKLLKSYQDKGDALLSQKVGKLNGKLEGDRTIIRFEQTNLGHLIAEAQRQKAKADIGIMNSGGIRDSIQEGDVTYKDILKIHPFGNIVSYFELTGKELLDYLNVVALKEVDSGAYAQYSGISMTVNRADKKVENVKIQGKPLDLNKIYRISVPSYNAAGGDGYPVMTKNPTFVNTGFIDADVLKEFFEKNSPINAEKYIPHNEVTFK